MKTQLKRFSVAGCGAVLLIAAGCGGGGGGDSPAPSSTTLSGVASKGPLKGALVTAYGVNAAGAVDSTEIAHAPTGPTGAYTLNLGSYTGAVQLVVTAPAGATTADEATGVDVPLPSTFKLHANTVVTAPTGSQTQSASITPYTELANNIAKNSGGITPGSIANANGVVFALIGVDPVATQPSSLASPAGATEAQKRYALFNAAVSKLASSTPQTADPATQTCFTGAGTDPGKKIECATQQIADSVTVSVSSGQTVTTVNSKLVGLSDALVSIAADDAINKTGTTIATTDSVVKTLDAVETAAASGTATPISGGTTEQRTDVAAAKLFFSGLRSNAAALQSDAMSTGIADGVKAFGDSIKGEAAALTVNTLQVARLGDIAQSLWTNYTTGLTTSPDSPAISGFPGGCTVFQGAFPTQFGGTTGTSGLPYSGTSTLATAVANAKWVGCSVNSGPLATDGTRRYRQTILFNMAADATLANIPYLAVTRAQYVDTGVTYQQNLTPALSGTAGFTTASGNLTGFSLVGDLPPATTPAGALLAQRYPVNVAGQLTQLASGAVQATLASGKLGSVPVGASEAGLTIDLSPGGASVAVIPEDNTNATQVAAAKIDLVATISDSKGRLSGSLLVDRFSVDSAGDLVPGHAKFSGDVAVAPVVGGIAGTMVSFLSGSLEATNGSTPVVSFSGSLTLPSRPVATLTVSVTETSVDTYTLEGRYVQNGTTVTITGSRKAADTEVTFADSTGVSVSVTTSVSTADVTVSGRKAAVIDKNAKTITYIDGTFESLI